MINIIVTSCLQLAIVFLNSYYELSRLYDAKLLLSASHLLEEVGKRRQQVLRLVLGVILQDLSPERLAGVQRLNDRVGIARIAKLRQKLDTTTRTALASLTFVSPLYFSCSGNSSSRSSVDPFTPYTVRRVKERPSLLTYHFVCML